jgi:hypothetical protein
MKIRLVCAILFGGVVAIAISSSAGQNPVSAKKTAALLALRSINTAEAQFQQSKGRFGSFEELVASRQFDDANVKGLLSQASGATPVLDLSTTPESAVPGYHMRLLLAASGRAYSILLTDATEQCDAVFGSDERGVIFHGYAFGCDSPKESGAIAGSPR